MTDKVLISNNYKQLTEHKKKKPQLKQCEELDRHFSKDEMQMANRHMKRCSTLLIITEMQIKTTMRYHLTSVGKIIIKMATNNKCWRMWLLDSVGEGEGGMIWEKGIETCIISYMK